MIIFMGVAGSGKSVQGKLIADDLALPWLSTGEFLRMLVSGRERRDMLAGKLLTDKEIITLIQKIFSLVDAARKEFVLDGFPRTEAQADWLLNQAKHGQLSITAVVHLTASPEAVRLRLLERGRQDDTGEAIAKRFREYEQASKPILEHYRNAGVPVLQVNGEGDIEEIHKTIKEALQGLTK
jgi:adenylate kinase